MCRVLRSQIYLLVIIVIALTSCRKYTNETEVDQIYQYYVLSYNAHSNKTTISAYLSEKKINGKALILDEASTLKVNNKVMSKNARHYTAVFTGWIDSAQIIYHDSRGQDFVNTLHNAQYITNDNTILFSKSLNSTWYFGGPAISPGEMVELELEMKNNSSLNANVKSSQVGANYIYVPFQSLNKLTTGIALCQTKRSIENYNGSWTQSGGMTKSIYLSEMNEVTIVE